MLYVRRDSLLSESNMQNAAEVHPFLTSTKLFLSATENASVLFPIVSVANIAIVWLIGILFFKEKLTVLQTIGLILGVSSIVLFCVKPQ